MQRLVKSGKVTLESFCQGHQRACVYLHTDALGSLIFDSEVITARMIPETLLFDVYRMSTWQKEAHYIANCCTALVLLIQYLKGKTAVEDVSVSNVRKHFTDLFVMGNYDFSDFSTLSTDLCTKLDSEGLLMGTGKEGGMERIKLLQKLEISIGKPEDPVHKLM